MKSLRISLLIFGLLPFICLPFGQHAHNAEEASCPDSLFKNQCLLPASLPFARDSALLQPPQDICLAIGAQFSNP